MNSPATSRQKSPRSRPASRLCAIAGILLLSLWLTACASVSSVPRESLQIYQPRVLRLSAGQEVQTVDGRYRPQVAEVWHSDAAFRQLEQENLNLTAALAQERARQK